jgi:hypothetical protein
LFVMNNNRWSTLRKTFKKKINDVDQLIVCTSSFCSFSLHQFFFISNPSLNVFYI